MRRGNQRGRSVQAAQRQTGRGDQGCLEQAPRSGVPRPAGLTGRPASLCHLFRRPWQPQEGAGAIASPRGGHRAGSREGLAGDQHQGRRPADRRVRRWRILVPYRFRLFGAALQIHVSLCARTAVARRQHDVFEHVQGLRGGAGGAEGKAQRQKGAAHSRIQSREAGQFSGDITGIPHHSHPIFITHPTPAERRCSSTG